MIRSILLFFVPLYFCACTLPNKQVAAVNTSLQADSIYRPKYAKGFIIEYYPDFKIIRINDPFDSFKPEQTICVSPGKNIDKNLVHADQYVSMSNPRWVTLSSTHISTATLLNLKDKIVGVAEPHYISDTTVQQGIKKGTIRNVGMAMSPDLEVVISLRPSFVMVSPFPDITYSQIRNAGIAVVPNAGYMENTPLGRAEWMVFVAALFGQEGKAVPLFDEIENRYLATKNIAKNAAGRPSLFSGNLYQGVWHASMGNNYMSQYFTDAGANYIYKHVAGTGTLSLEFEKIFHDASLTEYWLLILNHPGEIDYETIEQIDPRYASFKAFKERKIIFTNADHSLFFEKSEQEPDVVLADITHALHPELNPEYHPVYFKVLR